MRDFVRCFARLAFPSCAGRQATLPLLMLDERSLVCFDSDGQCERGFLGEGCDRVERVYLLPAGGLEDALAGFGEHQVHHAAQRLLVRVALQASEAVEVGLAVRAAALADDSERMAQLHLAFQRAGVGREFLDEFAHEVVDVHPPAFVG